MRVLWKSPGFSLVVIAVLALGIGANTAMFSIIDHVLLHPFPFRGLDRLVELNGFNQDGRELGTTPVEFDFYARNVHGFEETAFWRWQNFVLSGVDNTDTVFAMEVSERMFPMLGMTPKLGRVFQPAEFQSSAAPVALIGDKLWRRHFGASPGIVGRQILLDGHGYTVIGVMGPEFVLTAPQHQVWIPYRSGWIAGEQLKHYFTMIGRLRPGVTISQTQQELDAVTPALPDPQKGWQARLRPFTERFTGEYRRPLLVLVCAVGLVLLIACANAANLLLLRSTERRREFAVRTSLGAGSGRLMLQILGETFVLGAAAAAAGILLAFAFMRVLLVLFPNRLPIPRLDQVTLNLPGLAVAVGLALVTAILSAIPACVALLRTTLTDALSGSRTVSASRGANRTRSVMIALEVAFSLLLLVGAGLMILTLHRLLAVPLGFEPEHVLTLEIAVPAQLKKPEQAGHYTRILEAVRSLPGVQASGITTVLPFGNLVATVSFTAEGVHSPQDHTGPRATYLREVSPEYISALGVRLLRGRDFGPGDTGNSPRVVIVNEELARRYWPGENPLGKRVSSYEHPQPDQWSTVVGVVESIKHRSLRTGADAELYTPYTQGMMGAKYTHLVIRASGDPLVLASSVQKRIHDLEPGQPVTAVKTMRTLVDNSALDTHFHTLLLELFAALALGLAVSGIFAVVSYSVTQRTREIGIRAALGASPGDVARFVLTNAMRPVLAGACLGTAAGLATTRVLQSELFETPSADPTVFAIVIGLLIATAAVAAALPAWRATRIDPAEVLRAE